MVGNVEEKKKVEEMEEEVEEEKEVKGGDGGVGGGGVGVAIEVGEVNVDEVEVLHGEGVQGI